MMDKNERARREIKIKEGESKIRIARRSPSQRLKTKDGQAEKEAGMRLIITSGESRGDAE